MTPTRTAPAGRRPPAFPCLAALGLLAGCTFGGPAPRRTADRHVVADCKADADRAYLQQNRVMLSERSQRDTPFSSSGTVGITSEGLPDLYGRSSDFDACLRSHQVEGAAAEPAVGGATSPRMDPSSQP